MGEVCALYGYRRIDTPAIEDTELIIRTSGGGSDVVQKETYTFSDRGGRSLTLRPEGTAPICRAYVQHGLHREAQPQKLYSIGDANCRPAYVEKLSAWLDEHDSELDEEARAKRATSPLRVFDVKSERVQEVLAAAPKLGESLCEDCRV